MMIRVRPLCSNLPYIARSTIAPRVQVSRFGGTATHPSMELQVSSGEDTNAVETAVAQLLENGWRLSGRSTLEKAFYFKTYTKVLVCISPGVNYALC